MCYIDLGIEENIVNRRKDATHHQSLLLDEFKSLDNFEKSLLRIWL